MFTNSEIIFQKQKTCIPSPSPLRRAKQVPNFMNCIEGNKKIIGQIINVLQLIDNQTYAQSLDIFKGASIGQHFRHIIDFYLCLLKGMESGVIDYASRDRNPNIEVDAHYAQAAFQQVFHAIEQISESQPLQIIGDFSDHSHAGRPLLHSSAGRELMFAHDHAVHHLAIIKIGMQTVAPYLELNSNLGVAPSTVKYRSETPLAASKNKH